MKRLPLVLLVLLALGVQLPAQPRIVRVRGGIHWVNSFEEGVITAEVTDAPIVVYACLSQHAACLNFEDDVLSDARFVKLSALFVMVRLDGQRRKDIAEKFGLKRYPALLYLDSGGEKVYQIDSNLTRAGVLTHLARTFFISMYNSGRRAREAGDVRHAIRRFQTLMAIGQGTPPADWARRDLERISADGTKKLSQANIALEAGDFLRGMELLDELTYEYRGTEPGLEAGKLFLKLQDDPKASKALEEVTRRRLASRVLDRAKKLDQKKELEDALIAYWDVVRDYPNTPAQAEASERATELARDRDFALRAAKKRMLRDCENWMEMAKSFEENRRKDKALEYYQRVVTHYAGTSHARKAREAINNLLGVETPAP